jgi:hypothetical protein
VKCAKEGDGSENPDAMSGVSGPLNGEASRISLFGCAIDPLKNQLADGHVLIEANIERPGVPDFKLDGASGVLIVTGLEAEICCLAVIPLELGEVVLLGKGVTGAVTPPTSGFYQVVSSVANRKSTAVDDHEVSPGVGVIRILRRAMAALISRSDKIMLKPG